MSVKQDKPFRNDSGERIPPYSVCEVEDVEAHNTQRVAVVKKPSSEGTGNFIVGPQVAVADAGYGQGSLSWGVRVKYNDGGGEDTPEPGEVWGGQDDSWEIHKDGEIGIFVIIGDVDTGNSTVRVAPLSGTSGDTPLVTAFGMAIAVKPIGESTVPDFTGQDVSAWKWTPGTAGPPSYRRSDWGEDGDMPTRWTDETGAVLVDFDRGTFDPPDYEAYTDAGRGTGPTLAPIIERFTETADHIGGGLGGDDGNFGGGGGPLGGGGGGGGGGI